MKWSVVCLLSASTVACGVDEGVSHTSPGAGGTSGAGGAAGAAGAAGSSADFQVQASVEQLFVTHAKPGQALTLFDEAGQTVATEQADEQGSKVFRRIAPGAGYRVQSADGQAVDGLKVLGVEESQPPESYYAEQRVVAGRNYLTMRDGTQLSAYVTLPGPVEQGPYPTVVNYAGYDYSRPGGPLGPYEAFCDSLPALCDAPAAPAALIAALNGYATVSVNMRGTGCSGGAYDFFEPLQVLDGYDVVEIVAHQDWVLHNQVGMVGISYPGISQLFVAKTKPPGLAAILPLSLIGNTYTTLVPGGMLNNGFALRWAESVLAKADPYGQGWEQQEVDAGDEVCRENQLLHSQKVDIIARAQQTPFYAPELDSLNPELFVDQIEVPVFLACAYQDEQTGPYCFELLNRFKGQSAHKMTLVNGLHIDPFGPAILGEWKTFLDIYVARRIPQVDLAVRLIAPTLLEGVFGVKGLQLPADRFDDATSPQEAKAQYEAEPMVRALFENGGGEKPGAPSVGFERSYASWPPTDLAPLRLYLDPAGTLTQAPPTATQSASRFAHDAAQGQVVILAPGEDVWAPLPGYQWAVPKAGQGAVFASDVLNEDLVMLGSASVDLFVRSTVDDAELEVSLTELRPDGQEMFVQAGFLRASHRALTADSTALWPRHSYLEADAEPLVAGQFASVRVGIPAFGHAFRKGSRIRIIIDSPGNSRAEWRFDTKTYAQPAYHDIGHDQDRPSSVLLPVIAGATAPTPLPACPSLRGQQCRPAEPFSNQAAP